MGLHGDFATMPLPDVFRWIAGARKTGVLRVEHGAVRTRIQCDRGRITGCSSDDPPKLLGQFLLFRGVITDDVLRRSMAEQVQTGRSLRDMLVDGGIVSRGELDLEVALKAEETILGLFDLDDASFEFVQGADSDPNNIEVDLEAEDLIAQGVKRREDMERARTIFEHPRTVLARTDKKGSAALQYDVPCRRVYGSIDGKKTIEEIVLHAHGTEYRVTACLLKLHDEGLIVPVKQSHRHQRYAVRSVGAEETPRPAVCLDGDADAAGPEVLTKVPVPLRSRSEIDGESLAPPEEFLLNLSDGNTDVRTMIWIAPLRPDEVLQTLRGMQDKGLIELRESADSGPALAVGH